MKISTQLFISLIRRFNNSMKKLLMEKFFITAVEDVKKHKLKLITITKFY